MLSLNRTRTPGVLNYWDVRSDVRKTINTQHRLQHLTSNPAHISKIPAQNLPPPLPQQTYRWEPVLTSVFKQRLTWASSGKSGKLGISYKDVNSGQAEVKWRSDAAVKLATFFGYLGLPGSPGPEDAPAFHAGPGGNTEPGRHSKNKAL